MEKINEKDVKENIFFCPTGTPSSKNSRRWTGKRFLPSKATTTWRKETEQWWSDNKDLFKKELENVEKPYLIGIHFVRASRHKFDWVNPVQTVQDEMTTYDYIDDDNTEEMIPIPLSIDGNWHTYDKSNPGVYVKVFSKKEEIEALTKLTNIKI